MRHIPHLLVPGPWGERLSIDTEQERHLTTVLRLAPGAAVSYTDGAGTTGEGVFGEGGITRGREQTVGRPPDLHLVVAAPRQKDRVRFLVEKVAELGATSLRWIRTDRSQVPAPSPARTRAWADAALEQSRGSWRLEIGETDWSELETSEDRLLVAEPGGVPLSVELLPATLVIGPEGGLTQKETPNRGEAVTLGDRILRTETAAMAAVALCRARPWEAPRVK